MGIQSGRSYLRKISDAWQHMNDEQFVNETMIDVQGLFFDANGIIYQMFRGNNFGYEDNPPDFYSYFFDFITKVINHARPAKIIYFAFDGVGPVSKLQSQLNRRLERHMNEDVFAELTKGREIDKCVISPGTKFMEDIETRMKDYIERLLSKPEYEHLDIYLSSHLEAGEGETKIFKFIKKRDLKDRIVLYGEDCDLYFYALINKTTDAFIINKHHKNTDWEIGSVAKFRDHFIGQFAQFKRLRGFDNEKLIRDLIFIFLLKGSDYVPAIPGFDERPYMLQTLLKSYLERYLPKFARTLFNAYLVEDDQLNVVNVRTFFELIKGLDPIYRHRNSRIRYYKQIQMCNLSRSHRKQDFYRISEEYIKSLYWTIQLYQTNLISWKFQYAFRFPPLLTDIHFEKIDLSFDTNDEPLTPFQSLIYITPKRSIGHVLPAQFKEIEELFCNSQTLLVMKDFYKRVFFQITVREQGIKTKLSKVIEKLNDEDKKLNESRKLHVFKLANNKVVQNIV